MTACPDVDDTLAQPYQGVGGQLAPLGYVTGVLHATEPTFLWRLRTKESKYLDTRDIAHVYRIQHCCWSCNRSTESSLIPTVLKIAPTA